MKNKFNILHIILVGVMNTILILVWFYFYEEINHFIWKNDFVENNRFMIPVIVMFFSLVVGLCIKYLEAPTCVNGTSMEAIKGGGEEPNWRHWKGVLLTTWSSLFSGAVIGPEGGIGDLSLHFASWFNEKFAVPVQDKKKSVMAAFSSGYNGLLQSPVFTAVLANDLEENKKENYSNLSANLLAGVIGFFIFSLFSSHGLADFFHLDQLKTINISYFFHAILFSFIGIIFAILTAAFFRLSVKLMKPFNNRVLTRILLAGVVISFVGYFYPIILFSGESGSLELMADPLKYSFIALVALALIKIFLLTLSLKSGFLGGPVFPLVFGSTAASLAVSSLFPAVPLIVVMASIMTAWLTILIRAPLMILLLVGLLLGVNAYSTAIMATAMSVTFLLMPVLNKLDSSKSESQT